MRKLFFIALTALCLSGCANSQVGTTIGQIATGTLPNPISTTNLYQLNNIYAIAAQAAVDYRNYCYSMTYAAILANPIAKPICQNRRANVRTIQASKAKAFSAVTAANNFVTANPTLDASAVISAATSAVAAFQSATPQVPK